MAQRDGEAEGVHAPDAAQLVCYIEQMLLELAELASSAGETALAASLALTAIQAGAAAERTQRKPLRRSRPWDERAADVLPG